jgi:hypothetical protein
LRDAHIWRLPPTIRKFAEDLRMANMSDPERAAEVSSNLLEVSLDEAVQD